MFFINVLCRQEARGGLGGGSPTISHVRVSCVSPSLFCRKLVLKETSFLKETISGHRTANAERLQRGGSWWESGPAVSTVLCCLDLELTRTALEQKAGGRHWVHDSQVPSVWGWLWWQLLARAGAESPWHSWEVALWEVSRTGESYHDFTHKHSS